MIYVVGFVVLIVVIAVVLLRGDKTTPDDTPTQIDPPSPGPLRKPHPPRQHAAPPAALVFARGLVLSADSTSRSVRWKGRICEQRGAVLDVEIPGREPYVMKTTIRSPIGLVRLAPGVALDLNVDPADPNRTVVLGPGGFTGPWLRAAQSLGS
jgi:hypothetical protein